MKERPIMFNAPMVRAILDGAKTQTRRLLNPQPLDMGGSIKWKDYYIAVPDGAWIACPYGQPGDRLWVREKTRVLRKDRPGYREVVVRYEADGEERTVPYPNRLAPMPIGKCINNGCHREASRIILEIVSVRVERLCDISEDDAKAEGATPSIVGDLYDHLKYRAGFESLWDSINGEGAFRTNTWVWVISFKRVMQ